MASKPKSTTNNNIMKTSKITTTMRLITAKLNMAITINRIVITISSLPTTNTITTSKSHKHLSNSWRKQWRSKTLLKLWRRTRIARLSLTIALISRPYKRSCNMRTSYAGSTNQRRWAGHRLAVSKMTTILSVYLILSSSTIQSRVVRLNSDR